MSASPHAVGTSAEDRADEPRPRYLLHLGLFLATLCTTTMAGALSVHPQSLRPLGDGFAFSLPLLAILLFHEFGHYVAARLHGVHASLPYFIPFFPLPPGFGTMGAVIGMRNVTSDRKKLIDIGAAGPLAGLVVAIPVILYGLHLSPVDTLRPGGMQEGNSILYALLKLISKGAWLPDGQSDVFLHPTAWAGWAGLLITMINLLPIWQLDGGHIATAYFGNDYNRFARILHRVLPVMAAVVFAWAYVVLKREAGGRPEGATAFGHAVSAAAPWLVWFVMVTVLRRLSGGADHPPVDDEPLPRSRRILFWIVVGVFVLIFMPVPLRMTLALGAP